MYVEVDLRSMDFAYREISLPNFPPLRLPEGAITVHYRVVDVFGSKIKFSDFMTLQLDASMFAGYSALQLESQIESVFAEIVGLKMAERLIEAIYPMLIISMDESGTATINYGSDFLTVGDVFSIYERGDVITDPYTKEAIGWVEEEVGMLTIVRTTPRYSFATVEDGGERISNGYADKRYVIKKRELPRAETSVRNRRSAQRESIDERF
jgi:hypothetical protein